MKRFCRSAPRLQAVPRGGGNTSRPNSQLYRVGCAAQFGRLLDDAKAKDEEYLELKSGEKIKVVRNGACLSNENEKCMPLATVKVGENVVEVLRDIGCNGVIVRREFNEDNFTGSKGYVMAIDRTLKEAPIVKIKVDTPYYTEVTQAIYLTWSLETFLGHGMRMMLLPVWRHVPLRSRGLKLGRMPRSNF